MALKTYNEIFTFLNVASAWVNNEKHKGDSKFKYALKKVSKAALKIHGEYLERLEDLNVEHCAVDKDGIILREKEGPGSYAKESYLFMKDGLLARNKARKTFVETPVEIAPFLAHGKDAPKDLTEAERDAFAGFVVAEIVDDDASDAPERPAMRPHLTLPAQNPQRIG